MALSTAQLRREAPWDKERCSTSSLPRRCARRRSARGMRPCSIALPEPLTARALTAKSCSIRRVTFTARRTRGRDHTWGTVFELTRSNGSWEETVLSDLPDGKGPYGGLIFV